MDGTDEQLDDAYSFSMIGGDVSLDLVNTLDGRLSGEPDGLEERLTDYARLVEWGEQAGILRPEQAARLLDEAERRPADARAVLARAIKLREALYRLFSAAATGGQIRQQDLDTLSRAVARAMAYARLAGNGGKFAWAWAEEPGALDAVLWPAARSAADLLVSENLERVRKCAGDTCGWLFVDMSRNRSRQWCDMNSCGNKAKARRHYHRTKQAKTVG